MKRHFFFVIILSFFISGLVAQVYSPYNLNGDQAMEKKNFDEAQMWYAEGIANCDQYSIKKLTEIWKNQPDLRASMRILMPQCYNCLKVQADADDTDAMYLLSEYYKNGIGVKKDSLVYEHWLMEYGSNIGIHVPENLTNSTPENDSTDFHSDINEVNQPSDTNQKSLHVFATYTLSTTMPVGVTVGFYRKFGAYISFKTSVTSRKSDFECANNTVINYNKSTMYYFFNNEKKWSTILVTAGMLAPLVPKKLFVSFGLGYGQRELFYQISEYNNGTDYTQNPPDKTSWCHDSENSYDGLAVELGGLFRYKKWIFSGGINSIALKDMDVYIGLGYSF